MQSRTAYTLVTMMILTSMACARQLDPEDSDIFDDNGDTGGSGSSKGGTTSLGVSGSTSPPRGGSSSLPPSGTNKSGTKNTGGSGGKGSAGSGGDVGQAGDDGGTVHMPVVGMAVQFKALDASESPVDFVGGELFVINDTAQPFTLSELKVRYYFTNEVTSETPSFIWQWGQFGPKNNLGGVMCTGEVIAMPAPRPGADSYVEFSCSTEGELSAGTTLVMSWKAGAQGMGKLLQGDDYSFAATQADNDKIVVLNGNTVVWGVEP